MSRLSHSDYLRHIAVESARFRDVLEGCDPSARVPSCPDWRAADLLWHLADVQFYWAQVAESRPTDPGDPEAPRPDSYPGLLEFFDEQSQRMLTALRGADPSEAAVTWKSDDQSIGFIQRRQAHEALIHRLDAELAAGQVTALDPRLAADGVDEVLDVMFGGCPDWGTYSPLPHFIRLDLTDVDEQVWVQLGHFDGTDPDGVAHHADDIRVVSEPGVEPDAVVEGPAGPIDAWLWRRGDDSEIKVHGDKGVYDHFRLAVNHPIT